MHDPTGPDLCEKIWTVGLWLLTAATPAILMVLAGVSFASSSGSDTSGFMLPLVSFVCAGASSPLMLRVLGGVAPVLALPAAARSLPHVSEPLARLVDEAAAIRGELDPAQLGPCLQRAWALANRLDALAPESRVGACEPTVAQIRGLLALHAVPGRPRLTPTGQCERLAAALAEFEAAVVAPASVGFRQG